MSMFFPSILTHRIISLILLEQLLLQWFTFRLKNCCYCGWKNRPKYLPLALMRHLSLFVCHTSWQFGCNHRETFSEKGLMVNLFINEIQVGLWLTKVKSFSFFVWWNINKANSTSMKWATNKSIQILMRSYEFKIQRLTGWTK